MGRGGRAMVVCGGKNMVSGISILDVDSGDVLFHIPTSASPPGGLVSMRDQFLVAAQITRHGSVCGGAINIWALNKPQSPIRSYTMEGIGPIACTKNGIYIAGAAPSGIAYLWEVTSGKLLKSWHAHHKALSCVTFTADGSLLISGSEDGTICIWSMVCLLDIEDSGSAPSSLLHFSMEHQSSITGLLSISSGMGSIFVSSSVDGSCKVWDLISGRLMQTQDYEVAITAVVLDPLERLLFCGSVDGRIFISGIDIGFMEDSCVVINHQSTVMQGHKGYITALVFSGLDLLSASEDGTICLWDVSSRAIIRRFKYRKGSITNLVAIPCSSMPSVTNPQRVGRHSCVSPLDKFPPSADSDKGTLTMPSCCSAKDKQPAVDLQNSNSLRQQILDSEQEGTPAALEMELERSFQRREWAVKKTKHIMEMSKQLQSRLLDLMQSRLLRPHDDEAGEPAAKRRKQRNTACSSSLNEKKGKGKEKIS